MTESTDKPYLDLELFPCAGGMAEGFRRAGVTFDLAFEWMADHCESYEQNLGHRPIRMDVGELLILLKTGTWRPAKPIRFLVADPPCTPWSRAGKRLGTADKRDMLAITCEIIALLRPHTYLIGNVPGLDDSTNLNVTQQYIGALSQHGYCTADYTRLDAANYGVPQHRVRPFWFGHQRGPCIQWAAPTHGDPDLQNTLTLPGVDHLLPWVSCRQALGHLAPDQLGRPVQLKWKAGFDGDDHKPSKATNPAMTITQNQYSDGALIRLDETADAVPVLRNRKQNSVQQGSDPDRPARVVGTSNLSDGNVLIADCMPRAGKRGRKWDQGRVPQGHRTREADRPSATLTTKPPRAGSGESSVLLLDGVPTGRKGRRALPVHAGHEPNEPNEPNEPSKTVRAKQSGVGANVLMVNDKHPVVAANEPSGTIRGGGSGHSAPHVVIHAEPHHPPSKADEPAMTQRAGSGGGANRALEWPWQRPATSVFADDRLAPPGHHPGSMLSLPNAVVISELAATILQGFPETWVFFGKTKAARWSQIGQAMPPPLAHAVATSMVRQWEKTPTGGDR